MDTFKVITVVHALIGCGALGFLVRSSYTLGNLVTTLESVRVLSLKNQSRLDDHGKKHSEHVLSLARIESSLELLSQKVGFISDECDSLSEDLKALTMKK